MPSKLPAQEGSRGTHEQPEEQMMCSVFLMSHFSFL